MNIRSIRLKILGSLAGFFLVFGGLVLFLTFFSPASSLPAPPDDAPYKNASLPIEDRIDDLMARMTTQEKIGQLALVEQKSIHNTRDLATVGIGALLSGGGAGPKKNTPEAWREMVNDFQRAALKSRLAIPILYGVDAVHGNTNVFGATVFPHNIGLAATQDADLVERIGEITAQELMTTGIYWNFSPDVDVVGDTRWGRTYETFGSNTQTVSRMGAAYIIGLQSQKNGVASVLATAKHFLGTGSMDWGTSGNPDFKIDQGTTTVSEATLRAKHLPAFAAAVEAGVQSVMVGHTSWNGMEMAENQYLLTDVLKGELDFQGFVVSDWYGVYEIPGGEYTATVAAVNAGVDLVMLPYDYQTFVANMSLAVAQEDISMERLDDAVERILRAKFSAGLFDLELSDKIDVSEFGSASRREVAREAVRESQVILKNTRAALPLQKTASQILVAGSSAHNLGRQSGGWTVEWQGIDGNWIPGTTILDAIKQSVSPDSVVDYSLDGTFSNSALADVGIVVVGEAPYAEGWGDSEHPALSDEDLQTIANVQVVSKKIVVIIISGRPLDLGDDWKTWDAIVAAWLPGTEGLGVTDVLFGDYPFTGRLPVAWPLE
ncbi:MAG: glycoside hydrolase family 3 protein [Patescibacteria group bacterium]|jgi:beta-glucosidase